jgi:hypothetical protein
VLCGVIVAKRFTDTSFLISCCKAICDNSNNRGVIHTVINSGAVLEIINNIGEGNDIKLVIPCIGILSYVSKEAP